MADPKIPPRLLGITAEQRIVLWLTGKWGDDQPCPYCGSTNWAVQMFSQVEGAEMGLVTCTTCAQAVLINMQYVADGMAE